MALGGVALAGAALDGVALAGAAPHTSFLAFSFLTCAIRQFGAAGGGSAHAISCFFLFDVCDTAVWSRWGRLRTRHFLFFPFWRVQRGSLEPPGAAPHTPFLAFFFLACAIRQFGAAGGRLRTRHFLLFSF